MIVVYATAGSPGISDHDRIGDNLLDAACAVVEVPLGADGELLSIRCGPHGRLLPYQPSQRVVGVVDEPAAGGTFEFGTNRE